MKIVFRVLRMTFPLSYDPVELISFLMIVKDMVFSVLCDFFSENFLFGQRLLS